METIPQMDKPSRVDAGSDSVPISHLINLKPAMDWQSVQISDKGSHTTRTAQNL